MEIKDKLLEHYQTLEQITQWFKEHRLSREMSLVQTDLEHLLAFYKMYLLTLDVE